MISPYKNRKVSFIIIFVTITIVTSATSIYLYSLNDNYEEKISPFEEFNRIMETWIENSEGHFSSGNIYLYDSDNENILTEQQSFEYFKMSDFVYSKMGYLFTYGNGKFIIQLDSVNKLVTVLPLNDSAIKFNNPLQIINSYVKDSATNGLQMSVKEVGKIRKLDIFSESTPEIKKYTISYEPISYKIQEITTEWWKSTSLFSEDKNSSTWITKLLFSNDNNAALFNTKLIEKRIEEIITIDTSLNTELPSIYLKTKYKDYQLQIGL